MKTAVSSPRAESVLAGTDQALILRLNLQSRPLRLAHYEFRHPCLYNEFREQQDCLLPNRDLLKLTRAARAMVLFLVSIRRRHLEHRGQVAGPGFTWEGPADSPAACLAEALHLSSQAWLKAWFGFFPPKISKTKSVSSMLFPHSNGAGKPASVSLRLPGDPGQTYPDFRPLRPASIRVFSSKTEELLNVDDLDDVAERLFQEGGWQERAYWSDEPPDSPALAPEPSPALPVAEVLIPPGHESAQALVSKVQTFRHKRVTDPTGQISDEIVLEGDCWSVQRTRTIGLNGQTAEETILQGDWPLEQFPCSLDQILQLVSRRLTEASDNFFLRLGSQNHGQNELDLRISGGEVS